MIPIPIQLSRSCSVLCHLRSVYYRWCCTAVWHYLWSLWFSSHLKGLPNIMIMKIVKPKKPALSIVSEGAIYNYLHFLHINSSLIRIRNRSTSPKFGQLPIYRYLNVLGRENRQNWHWHSFYYYSHVHNSLQHTCIGHQCLVSGGLALILGVYQRLLQPTDVFHGSCSQDIYLCAN